MSKKVSAFQVYSEDQVHQRHARSYRNTAPRSQSKYDSPPHRSSRNTSSDWREDTKLDVRSQERRSSSPEIRRDRNYDYGKYDSRREESSSYIRDSRYNDDTRGSRLNAQVRYRSDDQFDRQSWERDDRCNDYPNDRGHTSKLRKDDYLVMDAQREATSKVIRSSTQYSDSDEECLHESLRSKKRQRSGQFSDDSQRRWSSDDDYADYKQGRKRTFSGDDYQSPSPPPHKEWRESRRYSPEEERQNVRNYSDGSEESDIGHLAAPPPKKKKLKGSKKNGKGKDKKRKVGLQNSSVISSAKIQSLMDVKIPSSVKKQVEQSTVSAPSLPRFGESRSEFKFGHRTEDSSLSRNHEDDRNQSRYDEGSRSWSRFDDDSQRDLSFGRRDSESDKRTTSRSRKDSYSSRRSPDYEHRTYHVSDDEYDRDKSRHRKTSFNRDSKNSAELSSSRKRRQNSAEGRDWQRSGNRNNQRDRSPDFRACSDSDQDSDHGGRRSWRDERRDRQPKKKDDDRDKHQKEKKSKGKEEAKDGKDTKKASSVTKEKHDEQDVKMQALPCKDGIAVLLVHPHQICVRGRSSLKVLAGEVSVLGHTMDAKGARTYDLFSPTTSSLLTITTCAAEKEKKTLRKAARTLGIDDKVIKEFTTGAVVLFASKLDYPAADYICTHPPFTQLFRFSFDRAPSAQKSSSAEVSKVDAAFVPIDQASCTVLKASEDFDEALKKWSQAVKSSKTAPVALLCGGVNSGKSTFSRYMINTALNSVPKVCYLDCDVGQTEFSPPGTVSLTVVDKPVFGPPFCHQMVAESMCFYGMASPAEGPTRYVRCIKYVLKAFQKMEPPLPLVINTMGWNEGLGLKLFVDLLHLISPDLVIQLNVINKTANFPAITPQFPVQESGWLYNTEPVDEEESDPHRSKHELVSIQSLVTSRFDHTRVKLTPKNMRDLALLSHLMQGFPANVTLMSAVPYVIPWQRFAIHVCHCYVPQRLLMDSLNASVVALCKADLSEAIRTTEDLPLIFDDTPICECLGYGLVRTVDHKKQVLYIVTSIAPDRLAQVNTLMRGSITIPDQLFLKQSYMDEVPYVDALEPAMALGPVRPRSRMPRRN